VVPGGLDPACHSLLTRLTSLYSPPIYAHICKRRPSFVLGRAGANSILQTVTKENKQVSIVLAEYKFN
jgi:hypothetical protein